MIPDRLITPRPVMPSLSEFCHHRLKAIQQEGLLRKLRLFPGPQGASSTASVREPIAFSSNDYLGLANHPVVKEAAITAIRDYGAGSGASRLLSGTLPPHQALESALARFKGTEAALAFVSGYQSAVGTLTALLSRQDTVISDRLNHACLIDGMRLSGAQVRVFEHNDLDHLGMLLKKAAEERARRRDSSGVILVVTESVFSMDGDLAPLTEMVALKHQYGAWLMVDEAHGTGMFGKHRRGRVDQLQLGAQVEIQMGTLGKALGASGGFICGSAALKELLINRARTFIFSTSPCPAAAAAATAALQILTSDQGAERAKRLWQRVRELSEGLRLSPAAASPIIPLIVGSPEAALRSASQLEAEGMLVPAIRYPTVPRDQARLRLTLSSEHTSEQVGQLVRAINSLNP